MSRKYKIMCRDPSENGFIETDWVDSPPTTCPHNSRHAVNLKSVTLISRKMLWNTYPLDFNTTEASYVRATTMLFPGHRSVGPIVDIKVTCYTSSSFSYTIRIFDKTNNQTICQNSYNNTTPETKTMTNITNMPEYEAELILQAKINGDENDDFCYISSLNLFVAEPHY